MSSSGFPEDDLRLERLGPRDRPPVPYGEVSHVASDVVQVPRLRLSKGAYEVFIDTVFSGPGSTEWLRSLRSTMRGLFRSKTEIPSESPQS